VTNDGLNEAQLQKVREEIDQHSTGNQVQATWRRTSSRRTSRKAVYSWALWGIKYCRCSWEEEGWDVDPLNVVGGHKYIWLLRVGKWWWARTNFNCAVAWTGDRLALSGVDATWIQYCIKNLIPTEREGW